MAALFQCGTLPLAPGAETFAASLDLPFVPAWVGLTVRRPSDTAPLLTAQLSGAPSAAGFSGDLSAPVPSEGYALDYAAYAAEYAAAAPSDAGTAALSYADLLAAVARYLGYDPDALSDRERAECDAHVQSGVRQFYYPPAVEGCDPTHEWSFLRADGAVATVAGSESAALPDGFGRVVGDLYYPSAAGLAPVRMASESEVRERLSRWPAQGAPRLFAPIRRAAIGPTSQTARLLLWPCPDRAYELAFRMEGDAGRLSAEFRPWPLGGARFAECVLESCLAVAEARSNDESGLHARLFRELLVAAQAQDRRFDGGAYGSMSPEPGDARPLPPLLRARRDSFPVTYKGNTW